jgi:hypothetical protein
MLENKDFFILVISLVALFIGILALLIVYTKRQTTRKPEDRYDYEKHRIELDYMRKNLEYQLYDSSKRLEESERRWKDMNHLLISSQNRQDTNVPQLPIIYSAFLKNFGINDSTDLDIDIRQVFVLTPFNSNYISSFEAIRTACSILSLNCIRGDEEFIPDEIFPHILKQILRSRLIIANITGRNPNVLYELGIAHAIGKPTIIVSENFAQIPFDLSSKRIIIYEDNKDLMQKIQYSIKDLLVNQII